MLNVICMGGSGSFEKFPSETVKIPDTQTRRFELIKNPSTIPTTLARLLADRLLADYLGERGQAAFGQGGEDCWLSTVKYFDTMAGPMRVAE